MPAFLRILNTPKAVCPACTANNLTDVKVQAPTHSNLLMYIALEKQLQSLEPQSELIIKALHLVPKQLLTLYLS